MSVRLVIDEYRGKVALYDSVSGFAFGPVLDSEEEAETFLKLVEEETGTDPRALSDKTMERLFADFQKEREPA